MVGDEGIIPCLGYAGMYKKTERHEYVEQEWGIVGYSRLD